MFDYLSYRDFLQDEFNRRQTRKADYSLRSYAKDLAISPGRLSEILQKKQGLSEASAIKIAETLKLNAMESDYFVNLVESEHARSKTKREIAKIRLKRFGYKQDANLKMDLFKIISDWYHFAIVELTGMPGFRSSPEWIAKKLKITEREAQEGIERLIQVNLLAWKDKALVATNKNLVNTPTEIPSDHIKQHHLQILNKAKEALYSQPLELRDFRSTTLSISSESLPELKKILQENHDRLFNKAQSYRKKNKVYCYSVQLFSLETEP